MFSSKANSPYTQLFLTHIDERGESSVPVVLANFTAPDRAANIPEFVNAPADAIARINEQFLNDYSHVRAAFFAELSGDVDHAIAEYQKALAINPSSVPAHQRLGFLLYNVKHQPRGRTGPYHRGFAAGRRATASPITTWAWRCGTREDWTWPLEHLAAAVRLTPTTFNLLYNSAEMHCSLGEVLLAKAREKEAGGGVDAGGGLDPKNARAHYFLALAQAAQGMLEQPLQHYATRVLPATRPWIPRPSSTSCCPSIYAKAGQTQEALKSARKALELADARGDTNLVGIIKARMEDYRPKTKPN